MSCLPAEGRSEPRESLPKLSTRRLVSEEDGARCPLLLPLLECCIPSSVVVCEGLSFLRRVENGFGMSLASKLPSTLDVRRLCDGLLTLA